jgi:glycosyltransferase involved in cell wall biosynthesis
MISVMMPTYNAAAYVRPAIESILNQTWRELELIVVDDGSTDNTAELVNFYARQDPRVTFVQSDHRGGNTARNIAVHKARYPWIASMDADDISLPTRLERQLKAAHTQPDVVVWGSFVHHINSRGDILSLSRVGPTSREEFNDLRKNGKMAQVMHPTAMMKREILLKVGGYDERFPAAQDLELFERMAEYGPFIALPIPLVLYRIHANALSNNKFFISCKLTRYLESRHAHRLAGKPLPTLEQYLLEYERQSAVVRLHHYLDDFGRLNYRRAGLHYGEGNVMRTIWHLALAALLKPTYSVSRAYKQVIQPSLRLSRSRGISSAAS